MHYIFIYTFKYVIYVHMYIYVYTHTYTSIYIYIWISNWKLVIKSKRVYVSARYRTQLLTYICTYVPTYINMHLMRVQQYVDITSGVRCIEGALRVTAARIRATQILCQLIAFAIWENSKNCNLQLLHFLPMLARHQHTTHLIVPYPVHSHIGSRCCTFSHFAWLALTLLRRLSFAPLFVRLFCGNL